MTDMEILQLADQHGVVAVTKHEWDGKKFNHTDDYLDGDAAALVMFAKAVAKHERDALCQALEDQIGWDMYDPASTAIKVIQARGQA